MVTEVFVAAVKVKYPLLRPGVDYYFVLHDNVQVLDLWPEELAQPTAEELLAASRERALERINQAYEAEFDAIKRQYPEAERESWPIQLSEAADLAEDSLSETPFLDALVLARGFGETKAELAAKVQAKNQAYSVLSATLTGKRHALERQVQDVTTPEQVEAITW